MAKQIIHKLVDDLDGGDAEETVKFALDGIQYEIDLSEPTPRNCGTCSRRTSGPAPRSRAAAWWSVAGRPAGGAARPPTGSRTRRSGSGPRRPARTSPTGAGSRRRSWTSSTRRARQAGLSSTGRSRRRAGGRAGARLRSAVAALGTPSRRFRRSPRSERAGTTSCFSRVLRLACVPLSTGVDDVVHRLWTGSPDFAVRVLRCGWGTPVERAKLAKTSAQDVSGGP